VSDPRNQARERAITRLRKHAEVLAEAFDLPLGSIDAESERVRSRYGICYADGRIKIRLHRLRDPDLLKYSVMVDTLCHELAHLRHFDHGRRFWRLYRRIREYAQRHGIYRPGPEPVAPRATAFEALPPAITRAAPRRPPGPVQLELF
jgi:predicted metal-dependent hydrolase